jgi:PBP1b-binding outer membrane lipoprotein LpoB
MMRLLSILLATSTAILLTGCFTTPMVRDAEDQPVDRVIGRNLYKFPAPPVPSAAGNGKLKAPMESRRIIVVE